MAGAPPPSSFAEEKASLRLGQLPELAAGLLVAGGAVAGVLALTGGDETTRGNTHRGATAAYDYL